MSEDRGRIPSWKICCRARITSPVSATGFVRSRGRCFHCSEFRCAKLPVTLAGLAAGKGESITVQSQSSSITTQPVDLVSTDPWGGVVGSQGSRRTSRSRRAKKHFANIAYLVLLEPSRSNRPIRPRHASLLFRPGEVQA